MPYAPGTVFEAVNHSEGQGCSDCQDYSDTEGFLNTACVYTVGCPWELSLFLLVGCYRQILSMHVFLANQVCLLIDETKKVPVLL